MSAPELEQPLPALGGALDFLRIVWALEHALETTSRRMERTFGVTARQRMILRVVGRYPGIAAGHLARILHIDRGTLSAALKRLEARRLLTRTPDPRDGRRVLIALSPEGKKLDIPSPGSVEQAVESVIQALGPSQVLAFRTGLEQLTLQLEKVAEKP
ncbi:MAG: MarR family transcriptional regulator [Deltaproteobacteria bacterium]|nr:MarR family transcriptional regulator [Deltaproteobacteria bacterium]